MLLGRALRWATRISELWSLYLSILCNWDGFSNRFPNKSLNAYSGNMELAYMLVLQKTIILRWVKIEVRFSRRFKFQQPHLLPDGSPSWVMGRNTTKTSKLVHMNETVMKVPHDEKKKISIFILWTASSLITLSYTVTKLVYEEKHCENYKLFFSESRNQKQKFDEWRLSRS